MTDADLAVRTVGLRKTYRGIRGKHVAVQGLDINVPVGGVHGFLGPNGSGKTTSIRMLLGLIRADSGQMEIFGQPVPKQLPQVVDQVGAIVESPKFVPQFSARLNLSLLAQAIGAPQSRVEEVLEATGLRDRAGDAFKAFSLGMKQRLAIAATLLKAPELLIFDEPTNGLDPAGIREVRQTMRHLADEGHTVLVSSHILSEVQQIADTASIIGRGKLLAEGRVSDLLAGAHTAAAVSTTDDRHAFEVLTRAGMAVRQDHDHLTVDDATDTAAITRALAHESVWVTELTRTGHDLESVFLELTSDVGVGEGGEK